VTHRFGWLGDVARFLPSWVPGSYYPSTKLANVLFANEMQRRLGEHGVQVRPVDEHWLGQGAGCTHPAQHVRLPCQAALLAGMWL
jgi:hypothetical protein